MNSRCNCSEEIKIRYFFSYEETILEKPIGVVFGEQVIVKTLKQNDISQIKYIL